MNPTTPTQLGYTPSGSQYGSQIVLGRNVTGAWEAIGMGANGRPAPLDRFIVNISDTHDSLNPTVPGVVNMNVSDLITIIYASGSNAPSQLDLKLREVSVCEVNEDTGDSEEKLMVVLCSQTYALPNGSE